MVFLFVLCKCVQVENYFGTKKRIVHLFCVAHSKVEWARNDVNLLCVSWWQYFTFHLAHFYVTWKCFFVYVLFWNNGFETIGRVYSPFVCVCWFENLFIYYFEWKPKFKTGIGNCLSVFIVIIVRSLWVQKETKLI